MSKLWFYVTDDAYRLPLVVGTSANDLAKRLKKYGINTTGNNIQSSIFHAKERGSNTRFECVEVDEI